MCRTSPEISSICLVVYEVQIQLHLRNHGMSTTAQNFLGDQNSPGLRSTQLLQTSLACWSLHTCLRSLVHPWSEPVGRGELCSMNPLHDGGELFLCSAVRSYIQAAQTRTQQSPFSNWKKKNQSSQFSWRIYSHQWTLPTASLTAEKDTATTAFSGP